MIRKEYRNFYRFGGEKHGGKTMESGMPPTLMTV